MFVQIGYDLQCTLDLAFTSDDFQYNELYKESDVVLCAPGGICMGGFQNWWHLFMLQLAKYIGKPLVYYGRSFGPFPVVTRS